MMDRLGSGTPSSVKKPLSLSWLVSRFHFLILFLNIWHPYAGFLFQSSLQLYNLHPIRFNDFFARCITNCVPSTPQNADQQMTSKLIKSLRNGISCPVLVKGARLRSIRFLAMVISTVTIARVPNPSALEATKPIRMGLFNADHSRFLDRWLFLLVFVSLWPSQSLLHISIKHRRAYRLQSIRQ